MALNLTDSHYRYGSYTRGDLKGDILYGVISFSGMEALVAPQFALVRDAWADRHRDILPPEKMKNYEEQLKDRVRAAAKDEAFFEQVWEESLLLRREIFASDLDDAFLRDAHHPNIPLDSVDIDQSRDLDAWRPEGQSVLFLLQDPRFFRLMADDIKWAEQSGLKLYAAVSDTSRGIFPSEAQMKLLFPDQKLRFLRCEGALDTVENDEALAQDAEAGRSFILYYGERGLTDCRNLAVPAFLRCVPESLVGKAIAGQFIKSGRCDICVPSHFDILPKVPLRKRTIAAYRHYAYLARQYGDSCYSMTSEEMYRRWPQVFFSVYDEENRDLPDGAEWPREKMSDDWYADFCARRDAALGKMLEGVPGVRRLGGWFALDTGEERPVPWTARGDAEGILVHGVEIDKAAGAQIVISEREAISPRQMTAEAPENGMGLILNYLFFLTPRLAGLYNQLRANRPREQAALRGGHMDYMLCRRDGRRLETFPLYRKACMGMKKDGSFVFFHFRLGGGTVRINGGTIRWEAENVDPDQAGNMAVYTPYCTCSDAGASKFTYAKAIGAGRVNLVLIQDQVICARDGDVLLPCMGVVLSMVREKGLRFLEECGFTPAEDGYFSWTAAPDLRVVLDPPEGFSPEEWAQVQWAYGGGLTLIQNGENCFEDTDTSALHLAREGWASPLSAQTQESDIASMVRHPRTAIGLTKQGKLFALVYSGRSSVSAGADYREMCQIAQKLVPDVKELMNVDGGGSAVLGITSGSRFIEYSWPSTSPGTVAGMVRPIFSLFKIRL